MDLLEDWMYEVLDCFDNIVLNAGNSFRLQEECGLVGGWGVVFMEMAWHGYMMIFCILLGDNYYSYSMFIPACHRYPRYDMA